MNKNSIRERDNRIIELERELSDTYAKLERLQAAYELVVSEKMKLHFEAKELKKRILPVIEKEKK